MSKSPTFVGAPRKVRVFGGGVPSKSDVRSLVPGNTSPASPRSIPWVRPEAPSPSTTTSPGVRPELTVLDWMPWPITASSTW